MPSTFTSRLEGLTTSVAVKAPCRVATTAAITLSGLQTIDGVALSAGDRVLVKNQSSAIDNGIWIASVGAWTRAADFDGTLDAVGGTQVMVLAGSANANTYWRVGGAGDVDIGQDGVTFEVALVNDGATVSFLQSGTGTEPVSVQDKLRELPKSIKEFGAPMNGTDSDVAAIVKAMAAGSRVFFPAGTIVLDDEIEVDKTVEFICEPSSEYDSAGTRFLITHDDPAKAGFKIGFTTKTITFRMTGEPKFDAAPGTDCYAAVRCTAASAYIDGFRGTENVNGLAIEDVYIGEITRITGRGKTYLLKTSGNTSVAFHMINAGASADADDPALQLSHDDGFVKVSHLYLEAQSHRNLLISSSGAGSTSIQNVYEENSSFYGIALSQAHNLTIENYWGNTNTRGIQISESKNVYLNKIMAASRLEGNEIVGIDSDSVVYVGGLLFNPSHEYTPDDPRDYVMVTGALAGAPAYPAVVNPELLLSANNTTSTVGGASISADVPSDRRVRFSDKSITINNSNPLRMPITKWRSGAPVVVQIVYKCSSSAELALSLVWVKNGSTALKSITSFNKSTTGDWQVCTLATLLPEIDTLDQYSYLELRAASGATAEIHFLCMSLYDGGMLPLGAQDPSVVFMSQPINLNTLDAIATLAPRLSGKEYRFHSYELVYETDSGAGTGAVVAFGDINSTGGLADDYVNFTTAASAYKSNRVGTLAAGAGLPFYDHWMNTAAGWCVTVTTAATTGGTARGIIRAVPVDNAAAGIA